MQIVNGLYLGRHSNLVSPIKYCNTDMAVIIITPQSDVYTLVNLDFNKMFCTL